VAEFEQQVVGVAVSQSGRVFVSFPRNGIDTVKNSVEEVIDGKAVAYPNEEINTLNTAAPSTHFLSAQSVYVDSSDTLWVLDVGNLGSGTALISGGAKLVAIDLMANAVKRTIVFPDSLITKGTSINDVRFDLARGAAGFAYIPDSSAAAGSGIIVVDLSTGNAVRRLANDPTVLDQTRRTHTHGTKTAPGLAHYFCQLNRGSTRVIAELVSVAPGYHHDDVALFK
jgi:hypothetical protein